MGIQSPSSEISTTYVVVLTIYTLLLVVATAFVIKRRHRQPLRFRDPYLLITTACMQYVTNMVFSPFVSPTITNCFLEIFILHVPNDSQIVLLMARFWKLFIASHLTKARLSNDTASWIYRHPRMASSRNLWRACGAVIAVLVLCQLLIALSDSQCSWGIGIFYFETLLLFGYWLTIAVMTWKLRHIQDGFFVVKELKMLGVLILGTNAVLIFWMANWGLNNTLQIFMNMSCMMAIGIQMWYPLSKTYSMAGTETDMQSAMVIANETRTRLSRKSFTEKSRIGRLTEESSFLDILKHPDGFAAMKRFLTLEFSVENLFCWQQLYAQKRERNPDKIDSNFRNIYELFIRNGSPNEVNINSKLKNLFHNVMKGQTIDTTLLAPYRAAETPSDPGAGTSPADIKRLLLNQLYREVVKLMEHDSFQRFKPTSDYVKLIQQQMGHETVASRL